MIELGFVKICSLREPEHAEWVVEAGADAFGLIFAEARRQVSVGTAQSIVTRAREVSRGDQSPLAVGIFLNASADEVNRVADEVGLDLVQLHGDEPPQVVAAIERPVVKVFRPVPGTTVLSTVAMAERYRNSSRPPLAFLIEGHHPGAAGGTGTRADWSLAAELAREVPLILAGGLKASNLTEAVAKVGPLGVDVGSGVEENGRKSKELIGAFVTEARRAFAGSNLEQVDVVPRS